MSIRFINEKSTIGRRWLGAVRPLDMLCFSTGTNPDVLLKPVHFFLISAFLCILFVVKSGLLNIHKLCDGLRILIETALKLI